MPIRRRPLLHPATDRCRRPSPPVCARGRRRFRRSHPRIPPRRRLSPPCRRSSAPGRASTCRCAGLHPCREPPQESLSMAVAARPALPIPVPGCSTGGPIMRAWRHGPSPSPAAAAHAPALATAASTTPPIRRLSAAKRPSTSSRRCSLSSVGSPTSAGNFFPSGLRVDCNL